MIVFVSKDISRMELLIVKYVMHPASVVQEAWIIIVCNVISRQWHIELINH